MRRHDLICRIILAVLGLSFTWPTMAQKEKTPKNEGQKVDDFIVADRFPLVVIDAQVVSRTTRLVVGGLTHKDFIISENGIQQSIVSWDQHDAPWSLLILVDAANPNNTSQRVNNQLQALKASLLTSLTIKDEASIVVIADRPIVLQDFTNKIELIANAVDKASQYEGAVVTPAAGRFSVALEETMKPRAAHDFRARKATVMISNVPKSTADEVILPEKVVRAMIKCGSAFCWSGSAEFPLDSFDTGELRFDKVSLTDLVGLTGGEDVGGNLESFIERLRDRHRIGYVPLPLRDRENGELVKIKLELAPTAKRKAGEVVLNYPRAAVIPPSK